MKKRKQITVILATICIMCGSFFSLFFTEKPACAEVKKAENSTFIQEQNETAVKAIALRYCNLYQKSFVDMVPVDMSDIVKETVDTFLYMEMLRTDVERAKEFNTGYKDYQLKITRNIAKRIETNRYTVHIIFDLLYHYKEAPELSSALYGVEYNFLVEKQSNGKWMIVSISSDFDEFDDFKDEVEIELEKNALAGKLSDVKNVIENVAEEKVDDIQIEKKQYMAMAAKRNDEVSIQESKTVIKGQSKSIADIQKAANKNYAYNASKGVQYASQFAAKSNAKDLIFYYVNGADCTNFVSQCIWAAYGGYDAGSIANSKKNMNNQTRMVAKKWYGGSGGGSINWESVGSFWSYVTKQKAVGPNGTGINNNKKISNLSVANMKIGEVIQVRNGSVGEYAHSVYITAKSNNNKIYVSQHSSAKFNRSLTDLIQSNGGKNCYGRKISFSKANFAK